MMVMVMMVVMMVMRGCVELRGCGLKGSWEEHQGVIVDGGKS